MENLNAQFKGRVDQIHDELVRIYEGRPFYMEFGHNLYPLWEDVRERCRKLTVLGYQFDYVGGVLRKVDAV